MNQGCRTREQWLEAVIICHKAHYAAAKRFERIHYCLGIPSVLCATIAGTAIFSTLQSSDLYWVQVIAGIVSLASAAFASLVTFLGCQEKAEQHKTAAVKYGQLRREIELYLTRNENAEDTDDFWEGIIEQWNQYDQESPNIPDQLYSQAKPTS